MDCLIDASACPRPSVLAHAPGMRRKVLQVSTSYLPWTVGGKEVYVHELSRALLALDWDVRAVLHRTPQFSEPIGRATLDGVTVDVLPEIPDQGRRAAIYGCRPATVPGFEAALRDFRPDVVHFHDFSVNAGIPHIDLAKASGARVVMTYHSPGQSCLQRSLLFGGVEPCDGEIRVERCTRCRLIASGAPPFAAALGAAVRLPAFLADGESPHRVLRLLTGRAMTDEFVRSWAQMLRSVDRIHVYADWTADLLRRNGARPHQLVVVRQGVAEAPDERPPRAPREPGSLLRLAFVGRCDEVKGIHVLVDAIQQLPVSVPVEASFFGPYWDTPYAMDLLDRMRGDARFTPPTLLPNAGIVRALGRFDACVVPSMWLETGPLVVLESFKAGTPVIGSRLGGIAEVVRDGDDGLLFTPGDAAGLSRIIRALAEDPSLLRHITHGVRPPRTRADLAREIAAMYDALLQPGSAS